MPDDRITLSLLPTQLTQEMTTMKKYRFDGYDAVIDEEGEIVYDDLSSRSGEIIADLLNDCEALNDTVKKLKERVRELESER